MKKIQILGIFLALSLVSGCSLPQRKQPTTQKEEVGEFQLPEIEEAKDEPEALEKPVDTEESQAKTEEEVVEKAEKEKQKEGGKKPATVADQNRVAPTPESLRDIPTVTEESLSSALSVPLTRLETLDNTSIVWGPGGTSGNQPPPAIVDLQAKYGEHGGLFIMPNSEEIFLSFDEGYELGYTPAIIETLNDSDVTGVFFVTLGYVKSRPDLVQQMIDGGHVVANHSSTHPVGGMPTLSATEQGKDLLYLHNYMIENFDYEMTLFRPPEGTFSIQSLEVAKSLGYTSVFWSFAYNDWNPEKQMDSEKAMETILNQTHPGAIYLLHAVSKTNAEVLRESIDMMRDKGYPIGDWSQIG